MTTRTPLPHHTDSLFLTDGGLETTLIFHQGVDLPDFASFVLLQTPEGRDALTAYFESYIDIARRHDTGIVLETPTWRANSDWAARQGIDSTALRRLNTAAVTQLHELRRAHETPTTPIVVSGNIGPRGDGYTPGQTMSAEEARDYHREQIDTFAEAEADLATVLTINYVEEATGIALAARDAQLPVVISFTLETDGALPTGQALEAAITEVDDATDGYASYFMINCAHPTHFDSALDVGSPALSRVRGLRANASTMSHAELDEAEELDAGDPDGLGEHYRELLTVLPNLTVLGGCCGTDVRHVEAIARSCAPVFASRGR